MTVTMLKNPRLEIINLKSKHLVSASQLLSRAFVNDPIIQYVFAGSGSADDPRLHEFFRFSSIIRVEMGWPIIGLVESGELMAVAALTDPGKFPWPDSLKQTFANLRSCIGKDASQRLKEYAQRTEESRPSEPHIYLGFIGTDPKVQGKGYGRLLLDWIHSYSESHPISFGVALDTENSENVPLYKHFGYRVTKTHRIDKLTMWCMYRPNQIEID